MQVEYFRQGTSNHAAIASLLLYGQPLGSDLTIRYLETLLIIERLSSTIRLVAPPLVTFTNRRDVWNPGLCGLTISVHHSRNKKYIRIILFPIDYSALTNLILN